MQIENLEGYTSYPL